METNVRTNETTIDTIARRTWGQEKGLMQGRERRRDIIVQTKVHAMSYLSVHGVDVDQKGHFRGVRNEHLG